MFINHLVIRNFRAVAELSTDLSPYVNVIVGPNGVGKTTIMQAIRLTKALTAARTPNEAFQVLISLGAASPHFQQRVFLNSLARDPVLPVEVRCTFTLTDTEIATLEASIGEIVQLVVSARLGQNFTSPAALVPFMQSQQGQVAVQAALQEISGKLRLLRSDPTLILGITLDGSSGTIQATDPLAGPLIAFLDQRLPPSVSIFSYFPADRALPMGETNLQLGGPDAQQQLEMHNSQPQLKYQRLKNMIINSLVITDVDRGTVKAEFESIFKNLLKGRTIKTINVNELGLLSVMTEESGSGRLIELDSLSSGEKNIALTFLIVATSVSDGGIALFDEPELHLNPAVSRDLLSFMMKQYSKPRKLQFIMCTHSPEILSGAFANEDCALLHLKSSSDITRVGKQSLDEYSDALTRLGTSVSESLLYEGTILVEGDDDVSFLEIAYPEVTRKMKVKDRGGRREIEKTIRHLQELEAKGQKVAPIFLIFDRDEELTDLVSTNTVKIMQWERRAIDNYMLDPDVLSHILKDESLTRTPIVNEGDVQRLIREIAFQQLDAIAAKMVYRSYAFRNPSLVKDDLAEPGLERMAAKMYDRWSTARASLPEMSEAEWRQKFLSDVNAEKGKLSLKWEAKWRDLCDGKRVLSDLYRRSNMRISEHAFRAKITQRMRDAQSEDWRIVKGLLDQLFTPS
ncbi:AAA family ATPase [Rhizobium herbae]